MADMFNYPFLEIERKDRMVRNARIIELYNYMYNVGWQPIRRI